MSQKTKQGKEHPLVSGPLLGPPLGSRILGVVQPLDPITELFDKETASPSGFPGAGDQRGRHPLFSDRNTQGARRTVLPDT